MNKLLLALVGCTSLFVGCANEVIVEEPQQTPSGGSSSSSSSSSSTGSSGTGSSTTGGGTTTVCVAQDQPPPADQATCKDLAPIVLVNPSISDDTDGDGLVEPGETALVTVTMQETSGVGFYWYPGVEFESKNPTVSIEGEAWFYGILPCGEMPATVSIKVAPDTAPGTVVTIHAQVTMLKEKCADSYAIEIPVKVQ